MNEQPLIRPRHHLPQAMPQLQRQGFDAEYVLHHVANKYLRSTADYLPAAEVLVGQFGATGTQTSRLDTNGECTTKMRITRGSARTAHSLLNEESVAIYCSRASAESDGFPP